MNEELLRVVLSPTNAVPGIVYGVVTTGILWAIGRLFSRNVLERLCLLNAAIVTALPGLGYASNQYPPIVNTAFGFALGSMFLSATLAGSRAAAAHIALLVAMNAPAAWLAYHLHGAETTTDKAQLFLYGYALWSIVVGLLAAFALVLFGSPEKVLHKIVQRVMPSAKEPGQ